MQTRLAQEQSVRDDNDGERAGHTAPRGVSFGKVRHGLGTGDGLVGGPWSPLMPPNIVARAQGTGEEVQVAHFKSAGSIFDCCLPRRNVPGSSVKPRRYDQE